MANEKRLIDANALLDDFGEEPMVWLGVDTEIQERNDWRMYRRKVENAPTVDAVEVVHGRWERVIPTKSAAKWSTKVSCSVCHKQGYTHHKFCPNCGAKMDGGNEDG